MADVHAAGGGEDLAPAPAARDSERRGRAPVVREAAKIASPGSRREREGQARVAEQLDEAREPLSTALQKKSVALVPNTPPVGTA